MATFHCVDCGLDKPVQTEGGTGYAELKDGAKVCYVCAGTRDRANMIETGKATLYLTAEKTGEPIGNMGVRRCWYVGNWPGTLKMRVGGAIRESRHNIAGKRYDVWFTGPDGKPWHGVQYGENTQICHCKRIKKAA